LELTEPIGKFPDRYFKGLEGFPECINLRGIVGVCRLANDEAPFTRATV
jgi:hypothetical protein